MKDGVDNKNSSLCAAHITTLKESVPLVLNGAGLGALLKGEARVIIKPNLVEAIMPPVTTPVALVGEVVKYIQENAPHIEIIIADGTGSLEYDTTYVFKELGYLEMSRALGVRLVDLNEEESVLLEIDGCTRWPEFYLPRIVMDSFLLSVPVLKAHTLAGVTLTMKNMVGLAPPSRYQQGGHWRKSA
ncbi:MAG: DUF362 domain-containing protein, partial [Proteobacteria bacterium]|nr:DUF362 domain-containing protein [Pseudomonadota bacterium]